MVKGPKNILHAAFTQLNFTGIKKEVAPADSTPVLDELEQYLAESEESSSTCSRGGRPRRQSGRRLPRWSSSTSPHRPPRASSASSRPRARCTAWRPPEVGQGHHARALTLRGVQHRVVSRLVRGLNGSAGERQRGSAPRPSGPRALPRPRCVAAAVRRAAVGVWVCLGACLDGRYLLGIWVHLEHLECSPSGRRLISHIAWCDSPVWFLYLHRCRSRGPAVQGATGSGRTW